MKVAPTVMPVTVGPTLIGLKAHATSLLVRSEPVPEPSQWLTGLLAMEQQLRGTSERPVVFQPAIFLHNGESVIWPRTVNLIQGQTGVHKSRIAEGFGSAVLATSTSPLNPLGIEFRPAPGEDYRLLYVDTERNVTDQLPFALQQLKARAGYELSQHPPNLHYTSLVMLSRAERFQALAEYIAHCRVHFGGHLVVILDVLSDCVADYNDVTASLELMDLLNMVVNEHNVTFICVIHENPGGANNKARGHLGTEAGNKASTILQVGFVREGGKATSLIQLLYLKRRYAAPGLAFFAVYDEASKGLVKATPELVELTSPGPQRKASAAQALKLLPELLADGPLPAGVLVSLLATELEVSTRTAKTYLGELLVPGAGYAKNASGHPCRLVKSNAPSGKSVLYTLQSIFSPT